MRYACRNPSLCFHSEKLHAFIIICRYLYRQREQLQSKSSDVIIKCFVLQSENCSLQHWHMNADARIWRYSCVVIFSYFLISSFWWMEIVFLFSGRFYSMQKKNCFFLWNFMQLNGEWVSLSLYMCAGWVCLSVTFCLLFVA